MKKITLSLAVATIALASCQKPETALPVAEQFSASVESFESPTKTSMTPEKYVVWSQNDRLAIFQGSTLADEYKVADASVGSANGTFSIVTDASDINGDFSAGTELPCNVALYPYSDDLTLLGSVLEGDEIIYEVEGLVLPAEQIYVPGSFANGSFPMVAVTKNMADHNLKFKNVLGALKLQLKGTQTVKSIKVTGKNNELLSGTAVVTAYVNNLTPAIKMTASDEASKSVTLNCGDGIQLSEGTATAFIIALPPVAFTQGFTVTVTDINDNSQTVETDKENTVLRSSILTMPEVSLEDFDEEPETPTVLPGDYVDEYGLNHGQGIKIGSTVWAPVNCGYHATDFKYGKLYQWGRSFGQGYDGPLYNFENVFDGEYSDATVPEIKEGGVSETEGNDKSNANVFYTGNSQTNYDWVDPQDATIWNSGTESEPKRTDNDPCPTGWRVPTYAELEELIQNKSQWTTNEGGQTGYWFSGVCTYSEDVPRVFFHAAGCRGYDGNAFHRGNGGYYWSSEPNYTGADNLYFFGGGNVGMTNLYRTTGYSVRCVQE